MTTRLLTLLAALPILGCLSADVRDADEAPGPGPLPFHLAVLAPTEDAGAARALADALARTSFVATSVAADLEGATAAGADLVLVARARGDAREAAANESDPAAPIDVEFAVYTASLLDGRPDVPRGAYGRELELRLPLEPAAPAVSGEERWALLGEALVAELESRRAVLERGDLVPVALEPDALTAVRRPDGTAVRGALRFAPEARTRRLRLVRLRPVGGEPVEARLVPAPAGTERREFEADLPPSDSGALVVVEVVVGSRVRLTRTFTVRLP